MIFPRRSSIVDRPSIHPSASFAFCPSKVAVYGLRHKSKRAPRFSWLYATSGLGHFPFGARFARIVNLVRVRKIGNIDSRRKPMSAVFFSNTDTKTATAVSLS